MKYKICPLCGRDVFTGSHWDCIFAVLESWSKRFGPVESKVADEAKGQGAAPDKRVGAVETPEVKPSAVQEGVKSDG